MKIRVPDYFKNFKCIASECEDTCCAGWEVVIDEDTYKKYKSIGGDFGKRLKKDIVSCDDEKIFRLKGNNCAFLNENKMCDIYSELGEESLCYICTNFPRVIEELGSLREIGLSLSCPEVSRIVLRNPKKIEFELSENDEVVSSYNDIDPQFYMLLMQCRTVIYNILQNRNMNLKHRVSIVISFVEEIQEKVDEDEITEIKDVKDKYLKESFINEFVQSLEDYKGKEKDKYNSIYEWFSVYKELIHINENDPLGLDKSLKCFYEDNNKDFYIAKHNEFNKYYEENSYVFEHILVYFVYRYFMKSVFDYDVLSKMMTSVVSYIMIKELLVVRWIENNYEFTDKDLVDIVHTYSKDIEHLEENIDILANIFVSTDIFTLDKVLTVVVN